MSANPANGHLAWRPRALRWSYRLKVPLMLVAVALVSGVAVAAATYALIERYVETNAIAQSQRLAGTLANSLGQAVLRNDVWRAFEIVRAPSLARTAEAAAPRVVVVDASGQVFVSLEPGVLPIGTPRERMPEPLAAAVGWILAPQPPEATYLLDDEASASWVTAARITGEDDALIGGVIVQQERGLSRAQTGAIVRQLALFGALAVFAVAVAGWIGGRRMIRPLERLRDAMRRAADRDVRGEVSSVSGRNDEVGDLGTAFLAMLREIDAKRELEREMLQAERMASIGRLTAGIAHEVNNPLGGMLTAIQNRRMRGGMDEATERTLALLERGVEQIHSTVGALLNEARSELQELREEDLHDLFLLVHPEAEHRGCALEWRVAVPAGSRLPSVQVRQVMLNLALNAIAAAAPGGRVSVRSRETRSAWHVAVANTGAVLDPGRLDELLQGRAQTDGGRLGLGLWITARLLHTLGGTLGLEPPPEPFVTELVASFPLRRT
ncbi:MAG: HAMP domain-containing histidine kinase [Burkholderiales bacterium]|nr:HAMP domain-containing histidine kinase [Burkholderiales bacterium]